MLRIIKTMLIFLLLSSCNNDFLDTKPTNSVDEDKAFSTPDNMLLVLNGLHRQMYAQSPLPEGTSRRSGQQYFIPMFDVYCGDLIHSARGNGWMTPGLGWLEHNDPNSLSVKHFWYQRYHFIATANKLISKVEENGFSKEEKKVANVLGQAYAYRAWAYHQLVTTYAKGYIIGAPEKDLGVPLLLTTDEKFTSQSRSTVKVVYDQIEKDINQSIAFLEKGTLSHPKSHISLQVAQGIKARITLSKGDWQSAAEAAVKAREGYSLMDESQWKSGFNTVDLPEVIWGGKVIASETVYYRAYFYYISPTFNGSQNRGNPKIVNKERYHQIPDTDYRKDVFLPLAPNTNSSAANGEGGLDNDPNYSDEAEFKKVREEINKKYGISSRHNLHPYMHVKFLQKNPGSIDPDDVIYMRSSEMYLIEAEAKAMLNDISGAQEALRPLGEARDSAYDVGKFTTKEEFIEHIKFQRYVELYGEGFSWHDHIRWDVGIDLTNSGASKVLYQKGFKQEKPSVNSAWIWKIPQAEIDANPNLTDKDQNK